MKKRIVLVALMFGLVMSMIPVTAFAASSAKASEVKASQYPKLMQGKLTKKQVEWVIESLIGQAGMSKSSAPLKLSQKKIKKMGKNYLVNRFSLYGAKRYDPAPGQYHSGKQKDQWNEAHKLKESNRILSFFTNYRYKKNKSKKSNGYFGYAWRTDSQKVYFYGGVGYSNSCEITSAKKSGKTIELSVRRWNSLNGKTLAGKYKVILKKQKNGRFKLYSIKQTWKTKSSTGWKNVYLDVLFKSPLFPPKRPSDYKVVAIEDIGGNSTPELFLIRDRGNWAGNLEIYTYVNGKAVNVKTFDGFIPGAAGLSREVYLMKNGTVCIKETKKGILTFEIGYTYYSFKDGRTLNAINQCTVEFEDKDLESGNYYTEMYVNGSFYKNLNSRNDYETACKNTADIVAGLSGNVKNKLSKDGGGSLEMTEAEAVEYLSR